MSRHSRGRILILSQNMPARKDRRVWQEAVALTVAGYHVSVICPKGRGEAAFQVLDGVRLYAYPQPFSGQGTAGFLLEFSYCWLATLLLSIRVAVSPGFDIIHACNPPDTFFAVGLLYRVLGKRFIYDQHDLCPELYRSRFVEPSPLVARILLWLELATYKSADAVIAPNQSYKSIAMERGRVSPERIFVVRNGPIGRWMDRVEANPSLRRGHRFLVCYVGVMGPQDGVELALRAAAHLVHGKGRRDIMFALLGDGDSMDDLLRLRDRLTLDGEVEFVGWVSDDRLIGEYLATADVCLSPEPSSPLNRVSTFIKIMEYMAAGKPIAAFDLPETRFSAGESALYAEPGDPAALGNVIHSLLSDPLLRTEMGTAAKRRVSELTWEHSTPILLEAYKLVIASSGKHEGLQSGPREGPAVRLSRGRAQQMCVVGATSTIEQVYDDGGALRSPAEDADKLAERALSLHEGEGKRAPMLTCAEEVCGPAAGELAGKRQRLAIPPPVDTSGGRRR